MKFNFKDCYVTYADNVLIIGNSLVERKISLENSIPASMYVLNKKTGYKFEAKGGKAPYTYQWQQKIKDDFVNIQNGAGISGALTSELSVKQSGNSAGEYRCIVTDSNGESVSSNAASVTKK